MAAALLWSQPSFGAPATSGAKELARRYFETGMEYAKRDQLEEAIAQLEAAYRISPHYAVLYSLGQLYAAAGKPVEAVSVLRRYLAEGDPDIDTGHRRKAEQLISANQLRIGYLTLDMGDSKAEVRIDGVAIDRAGAAQAIPVEVGTHAVTATRPGRIPFVQAVSVLSGQKLSVRIDPLVVSVSAKPKRPGQLSIACATPDVQVRVDDAESGRTPLKFPLVLAPGKHTVAFARAGYDTRAVTLDVGEGEAQRISCAVTPTAPANPMHSASLRVVTRPRNSLVLVDGRRTDAQVRLPRGAHRLDVVSDGYVARTQNVFLKPAEDRTVSVALEPTAQRVRLLREQAAGRRTTAYLAGTAGLGLLIAGIGTYAATRQRFEKWQSDQHSLAQEDPDENVARRSLDLAATAADVGRMEVLSYFLAGLGLGLSGVSAWLLFTSQSDAEVSTPAPTAFGLAAASTW